MITIKDKKIAVLGFGVEGQSAAAWFVRHGGIVTVFDERKPYHEIEYAFGQLKKTGVKYEYGPFPELARL